MDGDLVLPSPIGNRIVTFCKGAPAPTVVRVHVHAGSDPGHLVEVLRVYGAPPAATTTMAQRFATTPEDETLLVSLAKDGAVLGTAWPVFKDSVSLEFGIPDMSESEAAALLASPSCATSLVALRDHNVRPASAEGHSPPGGCSMAPSRSDVSVTLMAVPTAMAVVLVAVLAARRATRVRATRGSRRA